MSALTNRAVTVINLGRMGFMAAHDVQMRFARKHLDELADKPYTYGENALLLVEHPPVYTVGLRTKDYTAEDEAYLKSTGAEFYKTNRGGLITFHGPGQLVAYPILNLQHFKPSMKWYVCKLEETMMKTLQSFGLKGRTTDQTGVWVGKKKIGSIDKDENSRFRRILDDFYDYKSREFPEYATFVGKHDYDDILESFKIDAFDRRKFPNRFELQTFEVLPHLLDRSNTISTGQKYCHIYWTEVIPHLLDRSIATSNGQKYYHIYWREVLPHLLVRSIATSTGQKSNTIYTGQKHCHIYWTEVIPHLLDRSIATSNGQKYYHIYWREVLPHLLVRSIATSTGQNEWLYCLRCHSQYCYCNDRALFLNQTERFLHRLRNLDVNRLTKTNKRERRILISCLQTFVDGYKWRDYGALNSINFLEGLANGPQWPMYAKLDTERDFERYLKRLSSVPDQIYEQIALMKRAIDLKRSSHLVSVSRVPSMLKEWNVNDFFLQPFEYNLKHQTFSPYLKARMREKARSLIPYVSQALNRLKAFMDKDYFEATRELPGLHSLPHGLEYYEACLKWYLGYDAKAGEVFDLGVKEVSRIEKKIKEVMVSVGFDGDLKAFFKHIQTLPKFYNHTKEQILQRYREMLDDQILPALDTLFYNLTIDPITVVPAFDARRARGSYGLGRFFVNLKETEKRSTFTMMPLTLHEAYPGHHFQDLYSQHFDIPLYRAQPMNGRLYSVPFHFPVYSAYSEGWALYAEYLGHELGLYQDSYELFGRYVSEIFRACRLVVDTGIHAYGWSRDQAINFLNDYSDFPLSQIAAEVDRYITAPGQACSYKVGEIKIKNLRKKAEEALGSLFDIKEFHHQMLKIGYVPLDILEEVMSEWIQSKLSNDPSATSDYENLIQNNNSISPKIVSVNVLLSSLAVLYITYNKIT
ncbi:hypothetical protein Btru_029528 [Bulinus truncatus]|nr:hypothetical protein Btru_029528 [Bulinus truncatus]